MAEAPLARISLRIGGITSACILLSKASYFEANPSPQYWGSKPGLANAGQAAHHGLASSALCIFNFEAGWL